MSTVLYTEEYEKIVSVLGSFDEDIEVKVYEKESGIPNGSGNVVIIRIESVDYEPLSINLDMYKVSVRGAIECAIDNISKFNTIKSYLIKKLKEHSGSEELFIVNGLEQAILPTSHYLTLNFTFYYIKRVS